VTNAVKLPNNGTPVAWFRNEARRRASNEKMRQFRAIPRRRRAYHLMLTATAVPETILPVVSVKCLPHSPNEFWVRKRRLAEQLVKNDRDAGGTGTCVAYEFRRCLVCRRILIGDEAVKYRERVRWPKKSWHFAQGPACSVECDPKRKWRD